MNLSHLNTNGYRILPQIIGDPIWEDGNDHPIFMMGWAVADRYDECVFEGSIDDCIEFMQAHVG